MWVSGGIKIFRSVAISTWAKMHFFYMKPRLQSHHSHQWVMQSSQVCEGALPMCFAPWYDKIPGGIKKYGKKMKVRLSRNLLNWIAWTTNSRHQDLISDLLENLWENPKTRAQSGSLHWKLILKFSIYILKQGWKLWKTLCLLEIYSMVTKPEGEKETNNLTITTWNINEYYRQTECKK
jgi:uncharacterized protein (DUF779 family)